MDPKNWTREGLCLVGTFTDRRMGLTQRYFHRQERGFGSPGCSPAGEGDCPVGIFTERRGDLIRRDVHRQERGFGSPGLSLTGEGVGGVKMVVHMVGRGGQTGRLFFGYPNFPHCREVVAVVDGDSNPGC
jgi:hypothetical protein